MIQVYQETTKVLLYYRYINRSFVCFNTETDSKKKLILASNVFPLKLLWMVAKSYTTLDG